MAAGWVEGDDANDKLGKLGLGLLEEEDEQWRWRIFEKFQPNFEQFFKGFEIWVSVFE